MLYRNTYRIESTRLPGWDYSGRGYYFITVCVEKHVSVLGKISGGTMVLNDYGRIVQDEWLRSFAIRPQILRDEFTVMPNHFHAIIRIAIPAANAAAAAASCGGIVQTPCHGVSTDRAMNGAANGAANRAGNRAANAAGAKWKPGVLGAIIGQFKQQATKRIRANGLPGFKWQPRFYDHIIRNDEELFRIRQYIKNNPSKWRTDTFNTSDNNTVREDGSAYEKEDWMIVA